MNRHESMRGWFAYELHKQMTVNDKVWLLVGDLGYKVFDSIRKDYPNRFINTGAAEQTLLDLAVGLAQDGKIPFVYSITPFLLYRPFETIRTYIDHEEINVKLCGSGRDTDYAHDGFSHDASDVPTILGTLSNIDTFWPQEKEEIPDMVAGMVRTVGPQFISLKR